MIFGWDFGQIKRAKEKSNLTQILEQEHKKDQGWISTTSFLGVVIASRSSFLIVFFFSSEFVLIKYTSAFVGFVQVISP